ncbi:MAG: sigma-70 family RNA polymerase sigma factor [Solirubrobacterales bacterium]|jgi:RNA polymerase sigma factor (TIGR02999 family)
MLPSSPKRVTQLLHEWRGGNRAALEELLVEVYDELRRLARRHMRRERPDHTLQTTALVHEAFLRLADADVPWQDRAHFFSVAARQMRRILVDHARARASAKRGGEARRLTLDEAMAAPSRHVDELLQIDEALGRLAEEDPRKSQVVELRFFGGLTYEEIAEVLGVSLSTVRADLRFAKAWLRKELTKRAPGTAEA